MEEINDREDVEAWAQRSTLQTFLTVFDLRPPCNVAEARELCSKPQAGAALERALAADASYLVMADTLAGGFLAASVYSEDLADLRECLRATCGELVRIGETEPLVFAWMTKDRAAEVRGLLQQIGAEMPALRGQGLH